MTPTASPWRREGPPCGGEPDKLQVLKGEGKGKDRVLIRMTKGFTSFREEGRGKGDYLKRKRNSNGMSTGMEKRSSLKRRLFTKRGGTSSSEGREQIYS